MQGRGPGALAQGRAGASAHGASPTCRCASEGPSVAWRSTHIHFNKDGGPAAGCATIPARGVYWHPGQQRPRLRRRPVPQPWREQGACPARGAPQGARPTWRRAASSPRRRPWRPPGRWPWWWGARSCRAPPLCARPGRSTGSTCRCTQHTRCQSARMPAC